MFDNGNVVMTFVRLVNRNSKLAYQARVTQLCVNNQDINGLEYGLFPGRPRAVIGTNDGKIIVTKEIILVSLLFVQPQ